MANIINKKVLRDIHRARNLMGIYAGDPPYCACLCTEVKIDWLHRPA